VAVGRALAELAGAHQVLVVTHLPQVAAFADHQVAVTKEDRRGGTVASARPVGGVDRVVELSRMLSGQPASEAARGHAEELLATAASQRMSAGPAGRRGAAERGNR
jgi:DNA repair protein RecN (Recombination protein N)